jgi:5-methylthioadenosine/S-adenosylhomocysteine deaminase
MPVVPVDLSIEARWIVPMTVPCRVLENHSLVVRDGRILDVLPSAAVAGKYAATALVRRPAHLLMPGMVNTATHAAASLFRAVGLPAAPLERQFLGPEFVRDGVLAAIAEMLRSGITCFADRYYFPDATAQVAAAQGMRAVIGLPVSEAASPWANSAAEYLTQALQVRDEYQGHPLVSTAFAPLAPNSLSDATFARIATLADELDARILVDVHQSAAEIAECVARHGLRPMNRLWNLGLLTPALNAVHMTHATTEDLTLAERTGISLSLCPQSSLQNGSTLPPLAALTAMGLRFGLGSGAPCQNQDIWGDMKLMALMLSHPPGERADLSGWDALAAATRGGAAALGLDGEIGTLEPGKWADLCCADLGGPSTQPAGDPVRQLVFCGGRDIVSDVWVAGRQLLADGAPTRLDWPGVAARANAWAATLRTGG